MSRDTNRKTFGECTRFLGFSWEIFCFHFSSTIFLLMNFCTSRVPYKPPTSFFQWNEQFVNYYLQASMVFPVQMLLVPPPSIPRRLPWEALLLPVIRKVGKRQVATCQRILYLSVTPLSLLSQLIIQDPTHKLAVFKKMAIV